MLRIVHSCIFKTSDLYKYLAITSPSNLSGTLEIHNL